MALTEIYVDPAIAADSGAGTIGDPYGDLEYAIEQETFDTTNGTRVNIKAGTDEVLADGIDTAMDDTVTTVAWAPAAGHPLILQGYTSVAGDGGVGGIDGNGLHGLMGASAKTYCNAVDLVVHNTGSEGGIKFGSSCGVLRCEVYDCNARGIQCTNYASVMFNYVHDISSDYAIIVGSTGNHIAYNYVNEGTGAITKDVIYGFGGVVSSNVVILKSASAANGINGPSTLVEHNSVYCVGGGTKAGIIPSSNSRVGSCLSNLVEGMSGVGGVGIQSSGTGVNQAVGGNAAYDCTTAFDIDEPTVLNLGDNETLTESPFTDAAGGDFSPVDTGNVKEGALPQIIGGGLV